MRHLFPFRWYAFPKFCTQISRPLQKLARPLMYVVFFSDYLIHGADLSGIQVGQLFTTSRMAVQAFWSRICPHNFWNAGSYTEPDQQEALWIICDPPQENVPNCFPLGPLCPFKRPQKAFKRFTISFKRFLNSLCCFKNGLRPCYTVEFLHRNCNRVPWQLATHILLLRVTLHEVEFQFYFSHHSQQFAAAVAQCNTPSAHYAFCLERMRLSLWIRLTADQGVQVAGFPRLSRHKSVAQVALHGVTPQFCNCNRNIFQRCVVRWWENYTENCGRASQCRSHDEYIHEVQGAPRSVQRYTQQKAQDWRGQAIKMWTVTHPLLNLQLHRNRILKTQVIISRTLCHYVRLISELRDAWHAIKPHCLQYLNYDKCRTMR